MDIGSLVSSYLVPVVLGVVLVVGVIVVVGLVGRLGRNDEEDPAVRALSRRRGDRR